MSFIHADFHQVVGKIKPMHAVNNGPVVPFKTPDLGTIRPMHPFNSNLEPYKAAGIPFARTHDASFYPRYGMEHVVDVYYLFPNFDADPEDPENYDFTCTDAYVRACEMAGTKVFYRLGHRIEHELKKYGTNTPKDPKKWAIISEHIVRHYTEGWANGFYYSMPYWEIWAEPDLHWNTTSVSPTWRGTPEQYFELYHETANHLKSCFPHLKIGGPALSDSMEWAEMFLSQLKAPLDFFSWHCYSNGTEEMIQRGNAIRDLLDRHGYTNTESIMDEWSYNAGWEPDRQVYGLTHRRQIKGASFEVATMCTGQASNIDMLMYYDARPNEFWNGLFDCHVIGRVLKGYYPFPAFNQLYKMGNACAVETDDGSLYACAARGEDEAGLLLTHFNDDDATEAKSVTINLTDLEGMTEAEIYLLDGDHDLSLMQKITFTDELSWEIEMPNYTCYLILLKKKA